MPDLKWNIKGQVKMLTLCFNLTAIFYICEKCVEMSPGSYKDDKSYTAAVVGLYVVCLISLNVNVRILISQLLFYLKPNMLLFAETILSHPICHYNWMHCSLMIGVHHMCQQSHGEYPACGLPQPPIAQPPLQLSVSPAQAEACQHTHRSITLKPETLNL